MFQLRQFDVAASAIVRYCCEAKPSLQTAALAAGYEVIGESENGDLLQRVQPEVLLSLS